MRLAPILATSCLAIGLLAGCSEPSAPASSDVLTADSEPRLALLRLQNRGGEPIYYFAAEQNTMALLDIAICVEPSSCSVVPPGATITVPYVLISGYKRGSRNAVVLHWRLLPLPGGGYEADSIRALVVGL